jgi:hypothetical protein
MPFAHASHDADRSTIPPGTPSVNMHYTTYRTDVSNILHICDIWDVFITSHDVSHGLHGLMRQLSSVRERQPPICATDERQTAP